MGKRSRRSIIVVSSVLFLTMAGFASFRLIARGVSVYSAWDRQNELGEAQLLRENEDKFLQSGLAQSSLGIPLRIENKRPRRSESLEGDHGTAEINVRVSGINAKGLLYISAKKTHGTWTTEELRLRVDGEESWQDLSHVPSAPPLPSR